MELESAILQMNSDACRETCRFTPKLNEDNKVINYQNIILVTGA